MTAPARRVQRVDWENAIFEQPWTKVYHVSDEAVLLGLLNHTEDEYSHCLRVVWEPWSVFVTLKLGPLPELFGTTLVLQLASIVTRWPCQGYGTKMLQLVRRLAEQQGWGCYVHGPFNHASLPWMCQQPKVRRLPDSGFVCEP